MRVGFLTSIPATVEAFFLDWMREWSGQGWEMHVASGGPRPDGLSCAGYTPIRGLGQKPGLGSLRALVDLAAWRSTHQFDVIVTNTATISLLVRALPRSDRARMVYFCHGLHFGDTAVGAERLARRVERLLLRRTDAVICMNSSDERFFRTLMPTGSVLSLDTGVGLDTDAWAPFTNEPKRDGTRRLLWMGAFSDRKRPLDALQVLARMDGDVRLDMLGLGPRRGDAIELAATLGLSDRVSFPGHVDPQLHMASADVLVHTAAWEGYCRTLMEASAIGLTAVSYDTKGCRDVPGTTVAGSVGDVDALAASVRQALSGVAGGRSERPDFSWKLPFDAVSAFLASGR